MPQVIRLVIWHHAPVYMPMLCYLGSHANAEACQYSLKVQWLAGSYLRLLAGPIPGAALMKTSGKFRSAAVILYRSPSMLHVLATIQLHQ